MMVRWPLGLAVAGMLASASAAHATGFGIYDPRSLGMGGVGVATADSRNAVFFNPAMLSATQKEDGFSLGLPIVSGRAADPDKLRDDIDRLEPAGDELGNSIDALNASLAANDVPRSQSDSARLSNALSRFNTELSVTSDKALDGELFGGLVVGVPGPDLGVGVYASARAEFATAFTFASTDSALLTNLSSLAQAYATPGNDAADLAALQNALDTNNDGILDDPNLQSKVRLRGILLREVGVSLSHRFKALGDTAIGITPKAVKATTVDYEVTAQDSEIDFDRGKRDSSNVNFDLGIAKDYDNRFKAGLVVKNLLSKSYDTVLGNKVEVKPQARFGVSHHTGWTTVGFDVDLTENDLGGFGNSSQYAAIGAELDVWLVQLRLGYRSDLSGNFEDVASLGLGANLFGLHLDAAVAGNDDDMAASLQLGLSF